MWWRWRSHCVGAVSAGSLVTAVARGGTMIGAAEWPLTSFIRNGTLSPIDASGGTHSFGNPPGPAVAVHLHDPRLHTKLALNPEPYAAEADMDGR